MIKTINDPVFGELDIKPVKGIFLTDNRLFYKIIIDDLYESKI